MRDLQSRRQNLPAPAEDTEEENNVVERVGLGESGIYDKDIYNSTRANRLDRYLDSIAPDDEQEVCLCFLLYVFT